MNGTPKTCVNAQKPNDNMPNVIDPVSMDPIQMDLEDILDELEDRDTSIVCYVLGSNPPISVMEGYLKRIWGG